MFGKTNRNWRILQPFMFLPSIFDLEKNPSYLQPLGIASQKLRLSGEVRRREVRQEMPSDIITCNVMERF